MTTKEQKVFVIGSTMKSVARLSARASAEPTSPRWRAERDAYIQRSAFSVKAEAEFWGLHPSTIRRIRKASR